METKMDLPTRKRNRLEHYDYSSCGAYFITICTMERRNYFWESAEPVGAIIDRPSRTDRPNDVSLSFYGKIADEAINNICSVYPTVSVDHYVIMPDHIHILLRINADKDGRSMIAPTVMQIVKQLKCYVSKKIGNSIWQKSFYDHVIRNREDYELRVKYIYENPIRLYYSE